MLDSSKKPINDQCNIWNSSDFTQPDDNSTVQCTQWQYNHTQFRRSIIQQYDLVCDRKHWKNDAQSIFFAGLLVGVFAMGYSSDRFGRKVTIVTATLVMVTIGTILPFAPNIETFIALRFFHGFTKMGVFTIIFVWCMEQVDSSYKTYVGVGLEFPWVTAWLLLALLAYLVPDWQHLSLITSVPGFICIGLIWIMPESPKWLLTTGQIEKAEAICRQAAKENGKPLPDTWHLKHLSDKKDEEAKGNVFMLFMHKHMAMKTLIFYFNWFANSFVYYGLTLNTGSIAGGLYLNFFLNGVLEIPSYALSLFCLKKFGRKIPYVSFILLAGIALFCTVIIPQDVFHNNWPIVTMAMLGKFFISGNLKYIFN